MKLVLATRNAHKVREMSALLAGHDVAPLPDEVDLPPEDGETFAENALGKARAAAAALGVPVIADDSGICVPALGGAPGIRSARWAGERATDADNLEKLRDSAPAAAELEYVCVLAFVDPAADVEETFEGRCRGLMADWPRGEGGFGYDPVFVPLDEHSGRTMAELTTREKDSISHRGRAARLFLAWLASR
ncbi:unannotated protein [freshwater metagenome]|uniref:dITP/XTP pyrophosphatase n=1 Tax=freshwater metagenome TaxID=449393 RepID=A0A6J7IP57_9ZZZZ|nr:RdgB/HAM1 family non-canonical purine NTP pyrophosphatase [Actinomycetota bacterium]